MNIAKFLSSCLKSTLPVFGNEEITIGTTKINAIINEGESSNALGIAATNNERSLSVQFPIDSYSGALKSGMTVSARGESWQISGDPGSVSKDMATVLIRLVEPERRNE